MLDNSFAFAVSLASLLICVVNLTYTLIQRRTDKIQNKIYIIMIIILIVNSSTGILSAVCRSSGTISDAGQFYIRLSRYLYFATHTSLCPMFFYYVCSVSSAQFMLSNKKTLFCSLFFIITELIALTNPFTGWVYYHDATYEMHRNWAEYLIYLVAAGYYTLAIAILFSSWNVLSEKRRVAMVLFFLIAGIGVISQLINKRLKIEVLMEAIGFTGVLLAIENEDDRIDFGMGFYNRAALNIDIKSSLHNNRPFCLIVIRIANSTSVSKMTGSEDAGIIADIAGGYLKSVVKRYNIYMPNPETFVLTVYDKSVNDVLPLAESICSRFEEPWTYGDMQIPLAAVVMLADAPARISSAAEMFYMTSCPLPKNITKKLLMGKDLDYIIRSQSVESAVSRGLEENSFEVYYQPTYNIDGTIHGAEALLRMHDKELLDIFPDEFIPVAERIGLIDVVDDFVLDSVCKFIKTGVPQKFGMDSINVNLSVLQCMRPGFVERVNSIVDLNGVDRRFINFEITESIAADDYGILSKVIARLKNDGFMFSMDDYGTGYSNVSAVFSLDFDVIKIDKSLLWNAGKDELGMIIFEGTVRMIRQMKKKILVEGVETQDQMNLLSRLGVDYLQGFYFSKPVPRSDFVALLSSNS